METNLEKTILGALYDHRESSLGSPEMTFSELYDAIGVSPDDKKRVGEVRHQLFSLKNRKWVEYQALEDGSGGMAVITPRGARVIEDSRQTMASAPEPEAPEPPEAHKSEKAASEIGVPESCPASLEDLVQRDQNCAYLVQREDVLAAIRECFIRSSRRRHFIVLHGQPMVGKTRILKRLPEALGDEYLPLRVTGQGLSLNALGSLDAFLFDLADQLTNRFNRWTRHHGISHGLNELDQKGFQGETWSRAFSAYWDHLRHNADKRQPIVMFDEIECLLDYPDELNPQILTFLDGFIRDPDNGYFVMAGSERIQHSGNRKFSRLIARGYPIRVPYYDDGTISAVFSALQEYFTVDEDFLRHLLAFCDGHPRLLPFFYQAIRSLGKQTLEKSDFESVLDEVLDDADDILWALLQRLSPDEYAVVWLVSQSASGLTDELEYSLYELLEFQIRTGPKVDYKSLKRGVTDLKKRQWTQWRNPRQGLFSFKLGIIPLWVHRHQMGPNEVRH
jgi:hypothetical protein